MMRRYCFELAILLILIAPICFVSSSRAGRVYSERLETVLDRVEVIVIGKVKGLAARQGLNFRYTISVSEVLVGQVPTRHFEVRYHEPSTRMGDLRISPIVSGSGIEARLKEGENYIFLFGRVPDRIEQPVPIVRVEPLTQRKRVLDAWGDYQGQLK